MARPRAKQASATQGPTERTSFLSAGGAFEGSHDGSADAFELEAEDNGSGADVSEQLPPSKGKKKFRRGKKKSKDEGGLFEGSHDGNADAFELEAEDNGSRADVSEQPPRSKGKKIFRRGKKKSKDENTIIQSNPMMVFETDDALE